MLSLTRQMALDYGPLGVRVNAISPGTIRTELVEALLADQGDTLEDAGRVYPLEARIGEASEVGQAALWLAGAGASFVTGENLTVDGGIMAKGGWI